MNLIIDENLATLLIQKQFPQFAHLKIKPVECDGHDNRTFHFGDKMTIRLPSAKSYSLKVAKEQKLLTKLAPYLSLKIATPIAMGRPEKDLYPYPWSIYSWIEGKSANLLTFNDDELEDIAIDLANFLKELHQIHTVEGHHPGRHNYWRGDHPLVYNDGAVNQISKLE